MRAISQLHKAVLPHTISSRLGVGWLSWLYRMVGAIGYIQVEKREGRIVGVISGIGALILTLVVDSEWQYKGIGKKLITGLKGERWVYTSECSAGFYKKMGFEKILTVGRTMIMRRKI